MSNSAAALLLASGSRYRAELLDRLRLPFLTRSPDIDESPRAGEAAADLVRRLALAKARALSRDFPEHWILGSDQSAAVDGHLLGKPGTLDRARAQLGLCSGRRVEFHTAVVLLRGETVFEARDLTTVHFRTLEAAEIERYLQAEPALDCAGSFRCEAYGITLFDAIEARDPTALIGLPLIATSRLLRQAGVTLP